jgi:hypothetical protein
MSNIEMSISLPLDDDGYFRRECILCRREFKVLLEKDELTNLAQSGIDSFMIEAEEGATNDNEEETAGNEFTCPYCGQQARKDSWWTQEQLAYIQVIAHNILAKMVNEELIRPLKRSFGRTATGPISLKFEAEEMKQQEPWISPEINDMDLFDLPCCHRKMKVDEIKSGVIHCFFCGFPYVINDSVST